ncbi:hypothetical protein D082_18330 [Synechocystis sp. PCC 6714]|nr:hypothetical protein D082_18330 [Synechocystis sp. PCC 6714]
MRNGFCLNLSPLQTLKQYYCCRFIIFLRQVLAKKIKIFEWI